MKELTVEAVIALVRSKALYWVPQSSEEDRLGFERRSYSSTVDLVSATTQAQHEARRHPDDISEFSSDIIHFYARLLVLRCYEDYTLRHDSQPINLAESDRVITIEHPHITAMHERRLELIKLKHCLSGYLGPFSLAATVQGSRNGIDESFRQKLQNLLTDIDMLVLLYDNTMRIYEWHINEVDSSYKSELASEQLGEAKESKATAIGLGKLSNLAFLFLPFNAVCAMLGMNLSIYGQGSVPVWLFLL
jgi:Mg2+ and Co2+ transporter CorA